jgi:hypothetical protein
MKIIVETEEQKQKILEQSKYIHDFLISKDDVNGLGKDWIIGLDSDKAGTLMHLYMAPQIITTKKQRKIMTQTELIESVQKAATVIKAQQELIDLLYSQVVDLTMMSKIELGDDVIAEIIRLKSLING